MANVTIGHVYDCDGPAQEGHELAERHPVIVVGKQSLIDNQGIAIVVPLTTTPPNHPVHWAVRIEDTDSHAYVRHIKTVHTTRIKSLLGTATRDEIESIKEGLARDLNYDNQEPAQANGLEVIPGALWSARIPNARGEDFEGTLLILTSNQHTGMSTTLAVDSQPRNNPRQYVPVSLEEPVERGFAIVYQVRSISTNERLTAYRGKIQDNHLMLAKAALIRCIGP